MIQPEPPRSFSVGVTTDFVGSYDGHEKPGLELLEEAGVAWTLFRPDAGHLGAAQLGSYDAILSGPASVTAADLDATVEPPLLIARFGVGTDMLDLEACTRRGAMSAVRAILAVRAGKVPEFVANRAVLEHPRLRARLAALHG